MPRVCTICADERVEEINDALVRRQPYLAIARTYGVSRDALRNHTREHVPKILMLGADAERRAEGSTLLDRIESIHRRTLAILEATEETEDHRTALAAIREARSNLQLIGEVTKELDRQPVLNLFMNAEWVEVRALIVGALEGFPEARESVLKALQGGGEG